MDKKPDIHVVPRGNYWAVREGFAERVRLTVWTQEQAIDRGREISIRYGTELIIHGHNGRVRERRNFGKATNIIVDN